MAWRSGGTTNAEMVDNLKRFSIITSDFVEDAFRNVDRKFFVPKGQETWAHADQPLKQGNVHISAPHIYGYVLEALELRPNSPMAFLNVGSGTGYLSCLVAQILGPRSLNYGIEIHQDVVDHSKVAIQEWIQAKGYKNHALFEVIHGNALNVSCAGESLVGFDRIYVGASIDRDCLPKLIKLLTPGGILVGPVEDALVKVVRTGRSEQKQKINDDEDNMESEEDEEEEKRDYTQQFLSVVRFAPLLAFPALPTIIPGRVWSPAVHHSYPDSFREASVQLLLCASAEPVQPPIPRPQQRVNAAAMLPKVLWMEVLSFTNRHWFEQEQTETEFLRKRLLESEAACQKAQQARSEAEARCHLAERERDVYRLLARRWQSRLQLALQQQRSGDTENVLSTLLSREESPLSLSAILRHLAGANGSAGQVPRRQNNSSNDDEDDDDIDDADSENEAETEEQQNRDDEQLVALLEEDSDDSDHEEYDFQSIHSEESGAESLRQDHGGADDDSVVMMEEMDTNEDVPMSSMLHGVVRQSRTVSVSAEDL